MSASDHIPAVVVENLRAAVHASEGELAAQVVADGALDSKLLGLTQSARTRDPRPNPAGSPLRVDDADLTATINLMDNKPKLKPAPLPPPSGIPGVEIPTGPNGSWGLQELWTLLRRLLHRSK